MAHRQVVMITGASAGVGRATAIAFARRGARIGLLAHGREGLEAARAEVEAAGGQAIVCPADVAVAEHVEAAAATLERTFGPIDVWINNAMASVFSPVWQMTPEEFERVTAVTYLGAVNGTLAALRRMRRRNRGTIVQVGSALAYRGIPLQSAYCAATHAVQGFCDSLRTELRHDKSGIRLTMVHLPALNTPQFDWVKSRLSTRAQPVPPIFQPEVAADAIVGASAGDCREVLVGSPTVTALMGHTIAPRLADRYLSRNGYEAQQTHEPEDPDRSNNLWAPVDDDRDSGAHGRFDSRAHATSWQRLVMQHRATLRAVAIAAGLVGAAAALGRANLHLNT